MLLFGAILIFWLYFSPLKLLMI